MPTTNRVCDLCVSQLRQCLAHFKLKNRKQDCLMWIILLGVPSYLHCKTAHIWHWLVQTCATAYSKKTPNASTWTSARGKQIWPPAPMVQPRQVHARICSVAHSITSWCLFLMPSAPVTLLYLVKCPMSKKGQRKMFYKHFEYKVVITDQQIGQIKMQTDTNPSHTEELLVGKVLSLSSE